MIPPSIAAATLLEYYREDDPTSEHAVAIAQAYATLAVAEALEALLAFQREQAGHPAYTKPAMGSRAGNE